MIGTVFVPLPDSKLIGTALDLPSPGVLLVDAGRSQPTFTEIVDWPVGMTPLSMVVDGQNRVWFGTDKGIVMWNGSFWEDTRVDEAGGLPVDRLVQMAIINDE